MTCFIIIKDHELWKSAGDGKLENVKQAHWKGANFTCCFQVRSY